MTVCTRIARWLAIAIWLAILCYAPFAAPRAQDPLEPERVKRACQVLAQAWWAAEPGFRPAILDELNAALTDPANGYPVVLPDPDPNPDPDPDPPIYEPGETSEALAVTQNGITVRFEGPAMVGSYVNGDLAIVKPWPRIVSIEPASVKSGARTTNGAEINPRVDWSQGYDSAAFGNFATPTSFQAGLNVAQKLPLSISAPCSLVLTKSDPVAGARPQILASAVLTFVDQAPPAGAFRPPYVGTDKSPILPTAGTSWAYFTMPAPPAGLVAEAIAATRGPWTGEEQPEFIKRYLHPAQQMPDYGGFIAAQLGEAWLLTMSSGVSIADRQRLRNQLVQIGIDWYGVALLSEPGHWGLGGGHSEGVLETILLAGKYLGRSDMLEIRTKRPKQLFNAWGARYRVPASYVGGPGGYGSQHVGMPEWGNEHATEPEHDDVRWDVPTSLVGISPGSLEEAKRKSVKTYRAAVCLPSATGHALALWLQGIDGLVAPSDPSLYIDVQRRWRYESKRRGETGQRLSYFHPWALACWDAVGPKSDASYPVVP